MKRALMWLAVVGMLCITAGRVEAHGPGPMRPHPHYYGGRPPIVVMRPPVVVGPRYWVAPPPPRFCPPPCYEPAPASGFYYYGRDFSIGIGF
ncbi:MAG: hypothetical protein LLF97_04310 [Planctomycetaceae bacterium]|nr:hypothetical protein [Planctomycetaceae bacterium]